MERRKALAAASAATLVLGSTIVAAASVSGASFLGFGGTSHGHRSAAAMPDATSPDVLVRTRNVYDRYVVDTGDTGDSTDQVNGSAGARGASPDTARVPGSTVTTIASRPGDPASPSSPPATSPHGKVRTSRPTPTTEPADSETTPPALTPTTTAPSPPTTIATTTPTTWPVGVPKDWPKNKPIPPMPPNCRQPQLEDNGVWNCDH